MAQCWFVCFFKLNTGMVILKKQFALFWEQERGKVTLSVTEVQVLS